MEVKKIDTFSGHRDCVYSLVGGATPNIFYSAGGDGQVVEWDLARPDLGRLVAQIPASVYAMAYDGALRQLLIGQNMEGIQKLSGQKYELNQSLKVTYSAIFDIQMADNEAYIGTGDGMLIVVNLEKMAVRQSLKVSDKSIRSIAINKQANEIALGCSDSMVYIIDKPSLHAKQLLQGHTNSVFSLSYAPDGHSLLSAGRDAHIKFWKRNGDAFELQNDIAAHMYAINHLCFSPDGSLFASCSMDKSIKIWDFNQQKLLKVLDKARHAGHGTSVNKLLWSSYNNLLLSASDDRHISVWQLQV